MARKSLNENGQTQSVSIRLSRQEQDALDCYAAEQALGRSAAARQLIRTGTALRAEVRADILREIHPAMKHMNEISIDVSRFFTENAIEVMHCVGVERLWAYQDRIDTVIREINEILRAS